MRKYNLILIALMALIFVSCSENETVMSIPEEANAVLFDTYTGRAPQTRGVEMTDTKLQEDHFGVLGYYTAQTVWSEAAAKATPNFMYNQKVVHDSGWKYTPIKYWPTAQNDKVSFFAYAPYNDKAVEGEGAKNNNGIVLSDNATGSTPTITFTVQGAPENMVDLVTANALDKGNKVATSNETTTNTSPEQVDFKFNHVLSRVEFKAKASELLFDTDDASKKTYINIKSAQLNSSSENSNLYQSATYTFGNVDSDTGKGSWASGNTPFSEYPIDSVLATNDALHGVIGEFIGEEATNSYKESEKAIEGVMIGAKTGDDENKTHSAISIFKKDAPNNQYLFFIPAIKEAATDDGLKAGVATVTFDYDIVTLDKNLAKGFSVTSASKEVALPANTLKQGVAYTYTFTFNVDKVEVTATVADWDSKEEKEVKVDYTDKL